MLRGAGEAAGEPGAWHGRARVGLGGGEERPTACNCVTDVSAIGALTQLRQLFIWGPSIERLPDFTALTALEGLQVTASKVTTSPSFRALGELRDLVWQGPAPLDVEQLAALTNLRSVALMRHCIPDAAIEALRRGKPGLDLHTGERHPTCPR